MLKVLHDALFVYYICVCVCACLLVCVFRLFGSR
jgi:hypothetical protein